MAISPQDVAATPSRGRCPLAIYRVQQHACFKLGLTRRSPHLPFQDEKVSHPHRVPLGNRGAAAGEVERVPGFELLHGGSLAV